MGVIGHNYLSTRDESAYVFAPYNFSPLSDDWVEFDGDTSSLRKLRWSDIKGQFYNRTSPVENLEGAYSMDI